MVTAAGGGAVAAVVPACGSVAVGKKNRAFSDDLGRFGREESVRNTNVLRPVVKSRCSNGKTLCVSFAFHLCG